MNPNKAAVAAARATALAEVATTAKHFVETRDAHAAAYVGLAAATQAYNIATVDACRAEVVARFFTFNEDMSFVRLVYSPDDVKWYRVHVNGVKRAKLYGVFGGVVTLADTLAGRRFGRLVHPDDRSVLRVFDEGGALHALPEDTTPTVVAP